MFFGEFNYRVDEKGRVPIPPRFRADFADGLVLVPGPEKCIVMRTKPGWQKMADGFTGSSIPPSKMRMLNRTLFGMAFPTDLDGQGRVALPATLRSYAGIGDEVVVAGTNDSLEIWDKTSWEKEKANSQEQFWQIVESLEKR